MTGRLARSLLGAALLVGCTSTNVHDTPQAKNQACVTCHLAAYQNVQTPVHVNVMPETCETCHTTSGWIPTTSGHPEANFPITTGFHANAAIGCTDCHNPALGPSAQGANTDCVHCHIGAHNTPSIDTTHAAVPGYTASATSPVNFCLSCHPHGTYP
jgi:hypothetical protein